MAAPEKDSNPKIKSFRERRYDEKRDAIIKSAIKAFGKKGYHATTIEDITSQLTMTKGSLYYYFPNKEDLLYEAHLRSLDSVIKNIVRIKESNEPADAKIKAAIAQHISVLANELEGGFLLQHEFQLPEEYFREISALRDFYEKSLVEIIRDGISAGLFRIKNARLSAFIILGSINWLLRWYSSAGSWSVDEIVETYLDLLCNGFLTERECTSD